MDVKEKLGAIEAVLFASGEPVELFRLSEACQVDAGALPSMIRLINDPEGIHEGFKRYELSGDGVCGHEGVSHRFYRRRVEKLH